MKPSACCRYRQTSTDEKQIHHCSPTLEARVKLCAQVAITMISWGKQPRTMETLHNRAQLPLLLADFSMDTDRIGKGATNPAKKTVPWISGEAQVPLLQLAMPISVTSCGQPPCLETQACSSYSEVRHQPQRYLVPSACEDLKNYSKFRSACADSRPQSSLSHPPPRLR